MRRNIRAPQIENAGALTNRVTKTQERWPGRSHRTEGRNHYHLVGLKCENMTVPWTESAIPRYPPRRSGLAAQKCGTNMVLLLRSAAPRQGRSHNPITWHRVGLRLEGRRYRSLTMRDRRMCLCICVYRLLCYLRVGLQMLYVRMSVYARTMISYVRACVCLYIRFCVRTCVAVPQIDHARSLLLDGASWSTMLRRTAGPWNHHLRPTCLFCGNGLFFENHAFYLTHKQSTWLMLQFLNLMLEFRTEAKHNLNG